MIRETKASNILILLNTYEGEKRLYKSNVARIINCTNSHTSLMVDKLAEMELIRKEREGRRVYITITKKGIEVADNLIKIMKLLK